MSLSLEPFNSIGTDRFLIQHKLGSGAFGDVYRAFDQDLGMVVALKTLHRVEPAALYHFKNEFRSLAGVIHPNLVQLYELLSKGDRWFFTMELVEGLDFIEYAGSLAEGPCDTTQVHPLPVPTSGHDFKRLRQVLRQLAEGLCALHREGKLHCDIKPTNLRVTPEGRLVLLDFGLVHDLTSQMFQTMVGEVRGTPAYMSPEQAAACGVAKASDWYAVGGVLYEALTGELPFTGTALQVLRGKQMQDGPSPRKLVPYLPDDLVDLCESLLARDPERRPSGEQVFDRLGGGWSGLADLTDVQLGGVFVGRELQLAELSAAFELTRRTLPVAAFVRGDSGVGKTALVGRFIEQLRLRHPGLVVLAGRCYERESMPYKGLDSLMDTLSRYLKHLPRDEAAALLPSQVQALVRLFPALRRVAAVASAARRSIDETPEEPWRQQARAALRELLVRMAAKSPVLLFIDDLQWGDSDSAEMLADLLTGPSPPPLMFVSCYCEERGDGEPVLWRLLRRPEVGGVELREIPVRELWFSEACELGLKLLGDEHPRSLALARAIARESQGSPFVIAELVRYALSEQILTGGLPPGTTPSGLSLSLLIRGRLARLPIVARQLLELVAVAGRPVVFETAATVADLPREEAQTALKVLLAGCLVRLRGTPLRELEPHNDRIRETVLGELDGSTEARLRRRLAEALATD